MEICCPKCGTRVPLGDVDLGSRLAKCLPCREVFSFADQIPNTLSAAKSATSGRPRVPQPSRLHVSDEGGTLTIRYRWFHPAVFFLIFFCIAWDSFLVVWYTVVVKMLFNGAHGAPDAFKWLFAIFPIGHVAVGLGLTYFCLAAVFNKTTITVDRDWLSVRHGPYFWPGQCTLTVDEIDQLYCRLQGGGVNGSFNDYDHYRRRSAAFSSSLLVVLKDNRERVLWRNEIDRNVVLFLEQRIEDHLGLEDRRVGGEMSVT